MVRKGGMQAVAAPKWPIVNRIKVFNWSSMIFLSRTLTDFAYERFEQMP